MEVRQYLGEDLGDPGNDCRRMLGAGESDDVARRSDEHRILIDGRGFGLIGRLGDAVAQLLNDCDGLVPLEADAARSDVGERDDRADQLSRLDESGVVEASEPLSNASPYR